MKKENQLLARVTRALTGNKDEATEQVSENVGVAEVQAEMAELKAQVETITEAFTEKLEQAASALKEMTEKYEAAQAALSAIEAEKAGMVAAALAAKLAARKEKVVATIGTEKADALLAATENLDYAAFSAVVSALAGSVEAEADTELFKEVGVDAELDATKVEKESKEMKLLQEKYKGAK